MVARLIGTFPFVLEEKGGVLCMGLCFCIDVHDHGVNTFAGQKLGWVFSQVRLAGKTTVSCIMSFFLDTERSQRASHDMHISYQLLPARVTG